MNYFKTVGGILILVAVIGLELLFSAGVWYMVAVGMAPALGVLAGWLAALVAPLIGLMALLVFVGGHRLHDIILEWEAIHGKKYDEDHQVYYNKPSYANIITAIKWLVLIADSAGISFRVFQEHLTWYGYLLLIIVFEALAIAPWLVGILVHIVAHRPAYAIRREVEYVRDVASAQDELKEIHERNKQRPVPVTARHAPNQPALPGPKEKALPQYQANQESEKAGRNGL